MGGLRIVAGRWGGRRLRAPDGGVRPTSERVREAWMSKLAPALSNATVLDLFAGSGILGLEALSRGASRAVFVERSRSVARNLEANIAALDAGGSCEVVIGDVFRYLDRAAGERFDIAFADPPYGEDLAARLVARFRQRPFAAILSVEYRFGERMELPPDAEERRYGDTALAFLTGSSPSSSSSSWSSSSSSPED